MSTPKSRWVDLDGPVHYVDYGGPVGGPLVVCVHGLGGSLVNWAALAPGLAATCRVLALDLAGFGRTRSAGRSTSVHANQRLVHRFLMEVAGAPAVLVGNSMGGLVAALEAAGQEEGAPTVSHLVLLDPALPVPARALDPAVSAVFATYLLPGVGRVGLTRRRRNRSPEQAVRDLLRLCCADPSRVPAHVIDQHVALAHERLEYDDVETEFLAAVRSLLTVLARPGACAATLRRIDVPVLLLHGERDRLIPVAAARQAAAQNPSWQLRVLEDVGHLPQLEAAQETLREIHRWLGIQDAAAPPRAHPPP